MKTCPKCKNVYTDNTLSFCLSDGTPLTGNIDKHETEVLPNMVVNLETDDSLPTETRASYARTDENLIESNVTDRKKGVSPFWILATFGLLGIIIIGVGFAWFFIPNSVQKEGATGKANVTNSSTPSLSNEPATPANKLSSNKDGKDRQSPKPTSTPTKKTTAYRVVGVKSNDVLYIRPAPGNLKSVVGKIPPGGNGIKIVGRGKRVGKSVWVPIVYQGKRGWVNRRYISK